MQLDRDDIERSLESKGFVREDKSHRYFYHEYQGKRTGPYAYTSHGSSYKTYGDNLLKRMKKELRLDTKKQLVDLIQCPMSAEDYNQFLRSKNVIENDITEAGG